MYEVQTPFEQHINKALQEIQQRNLAAMQTTKNIMINRQFKTYSEFYEKPYVSCRDCLVSKFKCKQCLQKLIYKLKSVNKPHKSHKSSTISIDKPSQLHKQEKQKVSKPIIVSSNNNNLFTRVRPSVGPVLHQNILELPVSVCQKTVEQHFQSFDELKKTKSKSFNSKRRLDPIQQQKYHMVNVLTVQNIEVPNLLQERQSVPNLLKSSNAAFRSTRTKFTINKKRQSDGTASNLLPEIRQVYINDRKNEVVKKQRIVIIPLKKTVRDRPRDELLISGWQNNDQLAGSGINAEYYPQDMQ